ncbi:thymidine kinase [Clostridium perfringens]|nr:thymidine kinase [Clostridium perfringens]
MYNKIYFKYGTMFSGKSLNLISTAKTYKFNGNNVFIIKAKQDSRDCGVIKSRMSNEELKCYIVDKDMDDLSLIFKDKPNLGLDIILIDEVQFLTVKQIESLVKLSEIAPIICYGLKSSYTGDLFPSIVKLLSITEDIQEIKTTCRYCNKKATHNLLLRNGKPVHRGDMVNVEGSNVDEEYQQVCRYHFYNLGK